jgi:diadenosine tetraphosphate (Ap4A) HIT family hydrolase
MAECIFCQIVAGAAPCSQVYEDDDFVSFMDIYPWRPGHTLIIPKQHAVRVAEMPDGVGERLFGVGLRIAAAVRASTIACDDVHFLINDGRAANQSVPHVHLHVLPRRRGDIGKLTLQLLKRPLVPILRPARRAVLDDQAAAIRAAL